MACQGPDKETELPALIRQGLSKLDPKDSISRIFFLKKIEDVVFDSVRKTSYYRPPKQVLFLVYGLIYGKKWKKINWDKFQEKFTEALYDWDIVNF